MPFLVHGLKLLDSAKVRVGPPAAAGVFAAVLGLAVALPVTLYWQYDRGARAVGDGWSLNVCRQPLELYCRQHDRLSAQGATAMAATGDGGWSPGLIRPHAAALIAFGATFGLVVLFSIGRMRLAGWPLHPVLFLVLGTYQSQVLGFSFLLGWLVKAAVLRYGGAGLYRRLKPVMIGLVVGEMLAGLLTMLIGGIYYASTGRPPKSFIVLGA